MSEEGVIVPPPVIDFARRIKDTLKHVEPLVDEARAPILHYQRTVADIWGMLDHVETAFSGSGLPPAIVEGHLGRLYLMALVNLVETFERFLKEAAAVCVDTLAKLVVDDRFDGFPIQGSSLASHFGAETLGKSLCESSVWLDCAEINKRFRKLLSDPFGATGAPFDLFPKAPQQPAGECWRFEVMTLIWQIRHTTIHNVGVITRSDAVKLSVMAKEAVTPAVVLTPTRADLGFLKQFLDDTTEVFNKRIAERLATLLTTIHAQAPTLPVPADAATHLTRLFQFSVTVAGVVGILPPP
jgi:hypothetical protein